MNVYLNVKRTWTHRTPEQSNEANNEKTNIEREAETNGCEQIQLCSIEVCLDL